MKQPSASKQVVLCKEKEGEKRAVSLNSMRHPYSLACYFHIIVMHSFVAPNILRLVHHPIGHLARPRKTVHLMA
eukprot:1145355-Pelagomonas_calceolata.AAC.2